MSHSRVTLDPLGRLCELLADGAALADAWRAAGFASREEAAHALRAVAAGRRGGAEEAVPTGRRAGSRDDRGGDAALGVIVSVDGASRGNPGPASVAAVASLETGEALTSRSRRIGQATNNVAEYRAVIEGLRLARELGASRVTIRLDSELVARQLSGEYRTKNAELKCLAGEIAAEAAAFRRCAFERISRTENREADRLANQALDRALEP